MFQFNRLPIILAALNLCGVVVNVHAQDDPSFDDIVASDGNLTALKAAVGTGNISLTDASESPLTLFAPNNAAFAANSALLTTYADTQYIAHLTSLLNMHVIDGEVGSGDLVDGQSVMALNEEMINVTVDGSTVTLFTAGGNATVVVPDVASSDGVLHQIDSVLIPAFLTTSLTDLTMQAEGFKIVTELLDLTGLVPTDDVTATVFAPTDTAFDTLPEGALDYYRNNVRAATALLAGHVIVDKILPTQNMVDGDVYDTPFGFKLTVQVVDVDGTKLYKVNNATISDPNILASNGIIHALGSVINVTGAEYPPLANSTAPSAPMAAPSAPRAPSATPPVKAPTTSGAMSSGSAGIALVTMSSIFGWWLMA